VFVTFAVFDFHSEDFFPEEVPPHLSQRSRREIHHEADPSWPLLHRKPLRNEPENGGMNATTIPPKYVRQQFIVVQFGIGFGDDARHHFLVVADDGGVLDEGVHHDHLLEFTRRHWEPLDGDQFGDSALDEHPSATVVPRNVSGFEVAILHDRLGGVHVLEVPARQLTRDFGTGDLPQHHAVCGDEQLPGTLRLHVVPRLQVHDSQLGVLHHPSDGADSVQIVFVVLGRARDHGTYFRGAVRLGELHFGQSRSQTSDVVRSGGETSDEDTFQTRQVEVLQPQLYRVRLVMSRLTLTATCSASCRARSVLRKAWSIFKSWITLQAVLSTKAPVRTRTTGTSKQRHIRITCITHDKG
jgi:hypothetical protein